MLNDNTDLEYGFMFIIFGLFLGFAISPVVAELIFIGVAAYLGYHGIRELSSQSIEGSVSYRKRSEPIQQTSSAPITVEPIQQTSSSPITDEPTIADKIKSIHLATDFKCPSCGATVNPTDMKCKSCGSFLVASANLPKPEKWGDVEIGQAIKIAHPKVGGLFPVISRVYYGELWQKQMRPDVPWTLTGNYYVGLGLDKDMFLLSWQSRFLLLNSHSPLTDMDINRDFAPYARKFATSNQTAYVSFSYQEIVWRMDDIGRFRIEFGEGDGIRVSPGAVGRFIHASRDNKVLVVEDYQTGGSGLDTLWMGYRIEEEDIKF